MREKKANGDYTVSVYSFAGKKLRNCRPARARILLRKGKARILRIAGSFGIKLEMEESQEWSL